MNLQTIANKLKEKSIFLKEDHILNYPTVVGYEKKFKLTWMATQMNSFIVATDFGDEPITVEIIKDHLKQSFKIAKDCYTGWPRGFQSGLGAISILISSRIEDEAKEYCLKLKSGKKWAGFAIPTCYNSKTNTWYEFEKYPVWGRMYYPHFRKLIQDLK